MVQQRQSCLGQPNGSPLACEERRAQFTLQVCDLLGERRLRDTEFIGGAREVQMACRRHEVAQLKQFHACSYVYVGGYRATIVQFLARQPFWMRESRYLGGNRTFPRPDAS